MQTNNFLFEEKYSFDEYNAQLTAKAQALADELYSKKKKTNILQMLIFPFLTFFSFYILKLNIIKGKKGFIISYLNAFATFNTHIYLWLHYRKLN